MHILEEKIVTLCVVSGAGIHCWKIRVFRKIRIRLRYFSHYLQKKKKERKRNKNWQRARAQCMHSSICRDSVRVWVCTGRRPVAWPLAVDSAQGYDNRYHKCAKQCENQRVGEDKAILDFGEGIIWFASKILFFK